MSWQDIRSDSGCRMRTLKGTGYEGRYWIWREVLAMKGGTGYEGRYWLWIEVLAEGRYWLWREVLAEGRYWIWRQVRDMKGGTGYEGRYWLKGGTGWREVLAMKGGTRYEGRYWLKEGTGYEERYLLKGGTGYEGRHWLEVLAEGRYWLWREVLAMKGEGSDKQQVLESWADSAQWGIHKLCHLPNPAYSLPAFVNHTLIKQWWPTLMLSKLALLVTSYSRSRAVKKALTFEWRLTFNSKCEQLFWVKTNIQLKMWTVITAFELY